MNLTTITIGQNRPRGFGFRVEELDKSLLVKQISTDGAAYLGGLRSGDIILSINDIAVGSAEDFVTKMTQIKTEVRLKIMSGGRESLRSLSKVDTEQVGKGESEQMAESLARTQLSCNHILEDSYVPEEFIDSYLQPMSTEDTTDKLSLTWASGDKLPSEHSLSGEIPESPQITRKQAYKKIVMDVNDGPKFSFKRANKSTSFTTKDPSYVIKKKTSTKMGDIVLAVKPRINSTMSARDHPEPVRSPAGLSSENLSQAAPWSRPDTISFSGASSASQLPSPSYMQQSAEHDHLPQDYINKPQSSSMDLSIKVLSFNGKIKKSSWKKFTMESESLGVLFHSADFSEMLNPSNSTAIDPHISGLSMFMELWPMNNTVSRFFLPIGQQPYDSDLTKEVSADTIRVLYSPQDVDFLISIPKVPDDTTSLLFSILKLEMPEPKPVPTKTKRLHSIAEPKPRKTLFECPRACTLSCLPQSKLIKNVPLSVIVCVSIVERLALKNEGIYRKPGNEGSRKKLESVVNFESPEKWSEYEEWRNVNTTGSLLKSMLRTYYLIDKDTAIKLSMVNLASVDEANQEQVHKDMVYHLKQHLCKTETRTDSTKDRSVQEMRCRLDTFKYMIRHLERVTRYEEYNKMSAVNLATCFSPTIIEDIPCDEDGEYLTSKKNEADKNLKQMVAFWITNADLLCELLEEDDERQRHDRLISFLHNKSSQNLQEAMNSLETPDEDVMVVVKELIEYNTSEAFLPECSNPVNSPADILPESNNFAAVKNLGAYRSYKKPKTNASVRRGSLSLSPRDNTKVVPLDVQPDSAEKGSAGLKKTDNSKSFRSKKKERGPQAHIKMTSMRISGSTKDVPLVIDVCIRIIESFGLDVDSVYRISASKTDIEVLEELVNSSVAVERRQRYLSWSKEPYVALWSNIYVVACLLKLILKQICLIRKETWVHMSSQCSEKMAPEDVRNVLMAAAYHLRREKNEPKIDLAGHDFMDRLEKKCEDAIRSATLRYVLKHLKKVSLHATNNRMNCGSLAVCFMPALIEEDKVGDKESLNKTIQILEKLVEHCDWIFQWDDTPLLDMHGKLMSDSVDQYLACCCSTQTSGKTPLPEDEVVDHHIVDQQKVSALLENFVAQSHIVAQSRVSFRRHSDDLGVPAKTSCDFRDSKILDDSQLPDNSLTNSLCYIEPRTAGSLT